MTDQHEPEAEVEVDQDIEREEGLLQVFRERAISLATMERPLRLVTGIAIAELLVAAIFVALRDVPMPTLAVYRVKDELVSLPIPIFVAAIVFFSLSWAYLLSAISHARLPVRVVGLLVFLPLFLRGHGTISELGPAGALEDLAILGAILAVAALTIVTDARRNGRGEAERTHLHRLRVLTLVAFFGLALARYGLAWFNAQGSSPQLFTVFFTTELFLLSLFLVPVLFLAGADFAEWGEVTSGRVALLTGRVRPPILIAVLAAAVAGLALFDLVAHYRASFLPQLAMAVVVAAVILLAVRLARIGSAAVRARVPYAVLVLATLLGLLPLGILPGIQTFAIYQQQAAESKRQTLFTGALVPYAHRGVPTFSIGKPATWEVAVAQEGGPTGTGFYRISGISSGDPAFVVVISYPTSVVSDDVAAVTGFLQAFTSGRPPGRLAFLTSSKRSGSWRVSEVEVTSHEGVTEQRARIWTRVEGERLWLLMAISPDKLFSLNSPVFDAMAASWKPEVAAVAEAPSAAAAPSGAVTDQDRMVALYSAVWLGVLLVTLVILWRGAARGRPRASTVGLVFLAVAGAFSTLTSPASVAALVFRTDPGAFTGLRITGIQELAALATVALLVLLLARRRLTREYVVPLGLLLTLIGGLQVISWIYGLYNHAKDISGRFNIAQALIILLALLWDVTMSGDSVTNRGGRFFPRHARVLMFFGYVMLVASVLMYFSSLRTQAGGASVEPQFESEIWPQAGLVALGVPLLVTVFTIRMAAWWRAHREPPVEATTAATGPAPS